MEEAIKLNKGKCPHCQHELYADPIVEHVEPNRPHSNFGLHQKRRS